jgi:hypothetical protein
MLTKFRPVALSLILAVALTAVWSPSAQAAKKAKSAADSLVADKDKDEEDEAETHKKRAAEVGASGKNLDKAKTKGQLDKLTGQVGDLEKKMKAKGQLPAEEEPAAKKGKKKATTQPAPEEPAKGKKKAAADKADKADKAEKSEKSDK